VSSSPLNNEAAPTVLFPPDKEASLFLSDFFLPDLVEPPGPSRGDLSS